MVVLLVADDIDMGVEVVFCKTPFCCSEVLGDINGSTVRTEKEFPVKAVLGQVTPY